MNGTTMMIIGIRFANRTRVLRKKMEEQKMVNIIERMNVLEQNPIKEYTTLSGILIGLGISIAIIATIVFYIKTKPKNQIHFKDRITKIFLFWYVLGLAMAIFSVIRFPWFYVETGRYTYKCTFEDSVTANGVDERFNIINVEDGVWTVEDK